MVKLSRCCRQTISLIVLLVCLVILNDSRRVHSIITKDKLNKKFTLIFVGDSITAGIGTDSQKRAFPGLIRYALEQQYPLAKVISNGAGWRTV